MRLPIYGFLLSLALIVPSSHAEERFQVSKTTISVPESSPLEGFTITTDSHRFTFVPPSGASVKYLSRKNAIEILFADGSSSFVLQLTSQDFSTASSGAEQIKQQLLSRYQDAQITSSTECSSGIGNGFTYRIEYRTEAKAKVIVSAHAIPYQGGFITISQAVLDEKNLAQSYVIGQFLSSLRVEKLKAS